MQRPAGTECGVRARARAQLKTKLEQLTAGEPAGHPAAAMRGVGCGGRKWRVTLPACVERGGKRFNCWLAP